MEYCFIMLIHQWPKHVVAPKVRCVNKAP